jgi:hypothetical protein
VTDAEMDAAARRLVTESCRAQGIPETVTDPATLTRVAALMRPTTAATPARAAS